MTGKPAEGTVVGRSTRSGHGRHGNRVAYVYIAAAFAYLAFFVLYPIARAIWMSLTKTHLLTPTKNTFIGLDNYTALLSGGALQHTLWVTAVFVVAITASSLLIGVGTALLVETLTTGKAVARTLLALPWTIPAVVIALLFTLILDQRIGINNRLLEMVGLDGVRWLTDDGIALVSVPAELYDAAAVDGAGGWDMARRITIPFIMPTLQVTSLFLIIWSFQQFQVIWIMTQGGPINGTSVVSIDLYRTAFFNDNLGRASALGVIALIPALVITLIYFRVARPIGAKR